MDRKHNLKNGTVLYTYHLTTRPDSISVGSYIF